MAKKISKAKQMNAQTKQAIAAPKHNPKAIVNNTIVEHDNTQNKTRAKIGITYTPLEYKSHPKVACMRLTHLILNHGKPGNFRQCLSKGTLWVERSGLV